MTLIASVSLLVQTLGPSNLTPLLPVSSEVFAPAVEDALNVDLIAGGTIIA